MNLISGLSLKSLTKWSGLLIVFSLLVGLFLPLSSVQAGAEAGDPSISFTKSDTAICMLDPGLIEATVVVSIPGGETGKLETDWYIAKPLTASPVHHYATVMVNDGDEISFSGVWPGVNPDDEVVEIHFGAALKVNNVLVDTASLDYYWYSWVCQIKPTPTPTTPTPTEPTPTPTTPTPTEPTPTEPTPTTPTPTEPTPTTPTPTEPTPTPPDGEWDKSSLYFKSGCSGNCDKIFAEVCNGTGSKDMAGPTVYQVYYIKNGNPKNGVVVNSGEIPALASGACVTLTYTPQGVSGNYKFRAEQRPGHPGTGILWSESCTVACKDTPALRSAKKTVKKK